MPKTLMRAYVSAERVDLYLVFSTLLVANFVLNIPPLTPTHIY